MQLSPSTMLAFFCIFILIYHIYSVNSTNKKIWCTFRRADRTIAAKWALATQGRIEFEGGWYDVEPDRTQLTIKWNPLPMWVRSLDFRHGSARALHPDTFDNSYSAEARKQLDLSDDIRAYDQGNQASLNARAGKQGMLQQYFPIIVIGLLVMMGWMIWQQQHKTDLLGLGQNTIEIQMGEIMKRLPK